MDKSSGVIVPMLLLFAGSATTATAGEVYKCKTDKGVEFSMQPCGDNAEVVKFNDGLSGTKQPAKRKLTPEERAKHIGDKPVASAWDGSYREVETYLRGIANDPDSIEVSECSKAVETDEGWLVRCVYRGKNAFGALIRKEQVFLIRHRAVVSAVDWK